MFNGMWSEFLKANTNDDGTPRETFDLIFTSAVLEHIVDPMTFIEECGGVCNKYMFIMIPALDITFKDEPYGMFSDEHVNFFTLQSLRNLMHKAGFNLINFQFVMGDISSRYDSSGVVPLMTLWAKKGDNIPQLTQSVVDSSVYLSKYLEASDNIWQIVSNKIDRLPDDEKLALWGVGNHLHKLLGSTNLPKKNIVRLYDSDNHKHHHKVCGVPITAFNPDDVLNGEVEAILITTYTAQRAIKNFIDKQNLPCKVYTLYDIP